MTERIKYAWELPGAQYALHQDVLTRLGPIAAASLATVLLDGARRFCGICDGEETVIRVLAEVRNVQLPF